LQKRKSTKGGKKMKPRKVAVTIEIITDAPLRTLSSFIFWQLALNIHKSEYFFDVKQAQSNVIYPVGFK